MGLLYRIKGFCMFSMRLLTWFKGKFTGQDRYGNRYYTERFLTPSATARRPRRWVMFKGLAEGSKVPPEWHGWLHYTTDQKPAEAAALYNWQKPHEPNLTGGPRAYRPRKRIPGRYSPWIPG